MNIEEANRIIREYEYKSVLTDEEEFEMTEAFGYMIRETGDTDYMVRLGGYYYEKRDFDLARKYYEMADELGDEWAPEGLGYIWYYGRTGEKDYEKAFEYYSKAAKNGSVRSQMKVADMYKNGYFVEKDYEKYCRIIEDLYTRIETERIWDAKSDIYIRLANIRKEQGKTEEALELFLNAKHVLASKIEFNPFFGDLNVMSWLIDDIYELMDIDKADLDLFDLYYLLKKPCKVRFIIDEKECKIEMDPRRIECEVEAVEDGSVKFMDKWYRSVDQLFKNAEIDGEKLATLYSRAYAFEVVE